MCHLIPSLKKSLFDFCGLKPWQIGGLFALNDARGVVADEPISA
jgi:hypothetical protein